MGMPVPDFQSIQDCFLHDDGSLPGIELRFGHVREIPGVYEFLLARSRITTPEASFWDEVAEREVRLDSVPNAASFVVNGTTDCFRLCVKTQVAGVDLPELGLFVFRENLELDGRMGPEWTEDKVLAFFELLHLLKELAPSLELANPDLEGVVNPAAFFRFWDAYELERRTR